MESDPHLMRKRHTVMEKVTCTEGIVLCAHISLGLGLCTFHKISCSATIPEL